MHHCQRILRSWRAWWDFFWRSSRRIRHLWSSRRQFFGMSTWGWSHGSCCWPGQNQNQSKQCLIVYCRIYPRRRVCHRCRVCCVGRHRKASFGACRLVLVHRIVPIGCCRRHRKCGLCQRRTSCAIRYQNRQQISMKFHDQLGYRFSRDMIGHFDSRQIRKWCFRMTFVAF